MTFDVVLTNPCLTTSIDDIVFSPSSLTVADGNTGTASFTIPQDGVDKTNTVQHLCGTKTYEIKDSGNNVITTWAAITLDTTASDTYTLTIDSVQYPTHITSDVSETLTITTKLDSWSANAGNSASSIATGA